MPPKMKLADAIVEMEKITLGPDDVLVIRCDRALKRGIHGELLEHVTRLGLPGRRVMLIDPELTVSGVCAAEADALERK